MEHIAVIRKDALKTPFDVAGLITANQLLISAGVEATQAEKDILNLGDAISANGKGAVELDRIVVNLQQIKNVGKATEMDMKQFAFNGINMYALLADSTKKPVAELKEMDITYEMVSEALAKAAGVGGDYHEANLRQSASLNGLKSNLKDTASQTLINIANETGLFQATKDVTLALTMLITDAAPHVIAFLKDFGAKAQEVTKFLVDHKTEVQAVVTVLTLFFLPALVSVAVQMAINTVTAIANTTLGIIQFGLEGWKAIAMLIAKSIQLGIATAAIIFHTAVIITQTTAQIALTAATWLFNAAMAVATAPIWLVVAAIIALIAIGWLLIANWDKVKAFGKEMLANLKWSFDTFVNDLKKIGKQILDALVSPFEEAWKKIEEVVNKIKDKLDFTKRHSPSVVDIVSKGVREVNKSLGDLQWAANIAPNIAAATVSNGGQSNSIANIHIDMAGAIIANEQSAREMSELMGDSIIKKLQSNIRI